MLSNRRFIIERSFIFLRELNRNIIRPWVCIRGGFINGRVFASDIWGLVGRSLANDFASESKTPPNNKEL
jgi:hypothetical protein